MALTCNTCKEEMENQNLYVGEEGTVCMKCGTVIDDVTFEKRPDSEGTFISEDKQNKVQLRNCPSSMKYASYEYTTEGKKQGLKNIDLLASLHCFNKVMVSQAKTLFSKEYETHKKDSINKKFILSACCVFAVLRENNRPVLISDLCNFLQCEKNIFFSVYKSSQLDMSLLSQSIEELVPVVLQRAPFDQKSIVIEKTLSVLCLASSCWLTTGRSPNSSIISASFFAWKSLDFSRYRVTFSQYCNQFHFNEIKKTASTKMNEMASLLIKLAGEIPWIKEVNLNKNNVSVYLDDVLKHSSFLRASLSCENDEDTDVREFKEFRKPPVPRKRKSSQNCEENLDLQCTKISSSEEDEVISDSEIDKYIRTDEEVLAIKNIVKAFK